MLVNVVLVLCFFISGMAGCGPGSIYNSSYYSETPLEKNLFRVTFHGGHAPVTGDLCLLRCAEFTLSEGKEYFQVVNSESGSSFRSFPSSYPFNRYQIHDAPFVNDLAFVTKTIRLSIDKPETGFAYEARSVSLALRREYNIGNKKN